MLKELMGQNLKNIRLSMNLTQEEAAEQCNLSVRFWRKVEQGSASATTDSIEKISRGLQVSMEDLFQGWNQSSPTCKG